MLQHIMEYLSIIKLWHRQYTRKIVSTPFNADVSERLFHFRKPLELTNLLQKASVCSFGLKPLQNEQPSNFISQRKVGSSTQCGVGDDRKQGADAESWHRAATWRQAWECQLCLDSECTRHTLATFLIVQFADPERRGRGSGVGRVVGLGGLLARWLMGIPLTHLTSYQIWNLLMHSERHFFSFGLQQGTARFVL